METVKIRIDSLSYGGDGVGRVDGIVYFVPLSCPGDLLEIRITKREKRYRKAEIIRIIEPSEERVDPPCPYFGDCGGCQWQHVSYKLQLQAKERELRSALEKARLPEAAEKVSNAVPSGKEFGYRRTARFKVQKDSDGKAAAGFYQASSRKLVNIDRCLLLDEKINESLSDISPGREGLIGFDLFLDEDGSVNPFYRFSEGDIGADFFQINGYVNRLLVEYIGRAVRNSISTGAAAPAGGLKLLDLYCGDGNLSLQFADIASSITGWDSSKTAVRRGNSRAEKIRREHPECRIKLSEADISKSWKHISGHAKDADCIITDPPRKGLKNLAERVAETKVPLLIYVSCSPPALVRDLAVLMDAGYCIEEIQPMDMFPQTYHLETVTILKRSQTAV